MRIGILGSGLMGGKLGTILAGAKHEVIFSYARSDQKLKKLARDAKGNARAGTPQEATQEADAVLLAVHWSRLGDVLNQAGDLSSKVIVLSVSASSLMKLAAAFSLSYPQGIPPTPWPGQKHLEDTEPLCRALAHRLDGCLGR
jgi:predicted dinucleotide-binding enzyme